MTRSVTRAGADGLFSTDFVRAGWKLSLVHALVIALAGWWVYAPALHGEWIRDDHLYLNDALMNDPARLWKAWFQPGSFIEYYPITESIQWLQWKLWGNHPFGYHITNVILHIGNALLVWRLLDKLGLRMAWLGGLIFAVHPAQVESVAWISELKNTLSLAPFLVAMMAWIDYEGNKRNEDYRLALGLFLVAMLCKISMAPFPVTILLYAWWKRGRIDVGDLKASAPFFVISLLLGSLTILAGAWYSQPHLASSLPLEPHDWLSRLARAGSSMAFYFAKFFWPGKILPIYPQWSIEPLTLWGVLPWLFLAGAFYFLWRRRAGWGRPALFGLGFFLIYLTPFVGVLSSSYLRFTWVMDHFLYLPIIGLIGLVVAAIGDIEARLSLSVRPLLTGLVTLLAVLLAFEAHAYSGAYVNEMTLWDYTLEYNPDSPGARFGLADALTAAGKYPEAIRQYEIVLALRPNDPEISNELALVLVRSGRMPEAIAEFEQGLKNAPDDVPLSIDLAGVFFQAGRTSEAIALYENAVKQRPDRAQLQYDLGVALLQTGNVPEAAQHLDAAARLAPALASAHLNLGVALARLGHLPEAIEQFEAVLQLDSHAGQARDNLALALAQTGHIPEAIDQFQQALQDNPNDGKARDSLAKLRALTKNGPLGN